MLNVKKLVHTGTVVTSLNRAMNNVKSTGELNINNLYIADTIYSLLNTMCLSLTNTQRRKLISIYNDLVFSSKDICTGTLLDSYQQNMKSLFAQNKVDPSTVIKDDSIYVWKANIGQTDNEIINTVSEEKLSTSTKIIRADAEQGFNINLIGVGKYCVFIRRNDIAEIYDVLNNNITDYFSKTEVTTLNGTLFITNNMHVSGLTNLKIITNVTN